MCLISLLQQGVQASSAEDWDTDSCLHRSHLVDGWNESGIQPITSGSAAVDEFTTDDTDAKRAKIQSYINQVSYLTCSIVLETVCDKDRALIRKMIWNRVSLLRTLSNPACHKEEIEMLPSLTTLYDNLSQITEESVNVLSLESFHNCDEFVAAYAQLKTTCRGFYDHLKDLIPDDLWPVLDEETKTKSSHPYFLDTRSF